MKFSLEKSLDTLIEEQVQRTPKKIAVIYESGCLTYDELNRKSNQFARRLRESGVRTGSLVAIYIDRSLDMMIALLGVIKAGGVYVPLDLAYPDERVAYILRDSGAKVVVTRSEFGDRFSVADTEIVYVGDDATLEGFSDGNLNIEKDSHDAMYCIYTSGSTGAPKGALISHRSLVNHINWQITEFSFHENDVVLQRTSISFDASVWELWTLLTIGGQVVIVSETVQRTPIAIFMAIQEHKITIVQFVPTLLAAMLDLPFINKITCEKIFCGGEVLTPLLAKRAASVLRGGLVNLYGPTEATIDATFWRCPANTEPEIVPIGKSISNVNVYILDDSLNPVPNGTVGEIYIGGEGVAKGYINRAELTSERFVPDIFGKAGEKMYRTGDYGRLLSTGDIEFLGRADDQVKINGFRIELEEIQQAVMQMKEVRETVVLAGSMYGESVHLFAYIVKASNAVVTAEAVREFISLTLPPYMVPSTIVFLDKFPVLPNGKIDRQKLMSLASTGEQAVDGPSTETEHEILKFCSEVLKTKKLGVNGNFFEFGGHSLSATQVAARIYNFFGKRVGLREIFSNPTVRSLSSYVDRIEKAEKLDIENYTSRDWYETFGSINNQPSLSQIEILNKPEYTPAYLENVTVAFKLIGLLDIEALGAAFDALLEKQEALRTSFVRNDDGNFTRVLCPYKKLVPDIQHLPRNSSDDVCDKFIEEAIRKEAYEVFDLSKGPLLRYKLIVVDHDVHVLLISAHHIAFDGWSTSILFKEISRSYNSIVEGKKASPSSTLAIQYSDYADWQRVRLANGELAGQVEYWTRTLHGAPTTLATSATKRRPDLFTFKGGRRSFSLGTITEQIDQFTNNHQISAYTLLLSAFFLLMFKRTGQHDIYIRSPIANRSRLQLEEIIGYFVHPIVVRQRFSEALSCLELIGQVNEGLLNAFVNHDLPPQVFESCCDVRTDAGYASRFQLHFNYQSFPADSIRLAGIQEFRLPAPMLGVKTDLALIMSRSEDGIGGVFTYYEEIFDVEDIEALIKDFAEIVGTMIRSPATPCAIVAQRIVAESMT